MQEWQKSRGQLIMSRNKINVESKEPKFERKEPRCENQNSTIRYPQPEVQINNQYYNPEVTKTWHNYVMAIFGPLTLLIPLIYAKTNIIFFAELLQFRIHILFFELVYLISMYSNNCQLRNFVRTSLT